MTSHKAERDQPVMVWHDEADRLATWGTLDPARRLHVPRLRTHYARIGGRPWLT